MDFATFYARATRSPDRPEGCEPFPYQVALATGPELPDLLTVPTGAGKTGAVCLGWLWRRRFGPPEVRRTTPRRLVLCLPVRSLVDQTERSIRAWLDNLGITDLEVHVLQGGAVSTTWDATPERDAILVGTQDQLLSRALMRGYAMSRFRWPVQFAQLHNDCLWVFDEVQLMGVGASTSAQLEGLRRAMGTARPTRSLWMTATPAPGALATVDLADHPLRELTLSPADLAHPVLRARLGARKMLSLVDAPRPADRAGVIARHVAEGHQPGTFTLVVLNQVDRAQQVFGELSRLLPGEELRLLHARFRPLDRARQEDALAPHFRGVLVATQVVEAGVDVSARLLVTELAPWSSLVQRFGRCNRYGEHAPGSARVVVVDITPEEASPYDPTELETARDRLGTLDEVGPERLSVFPPPQEEPALPVLRRRDLLDLFDTEPDLAGHHLDVSVWIRQTDDRDVQIAWRELGGQPPPANAPEPHALELCRVSIARAARWIDKAALWTWDPLDGAWTRARRLVPGHVYVVDVTAGGYRADLGFTGNAKHVPAPVDVPDLMAAPQADGDDPLSHVGSYVSLRDHAADVEAAMRELESALGGAEPWSHLRDAALWHDLGKVHPVFQKMLTAGLPEGALERAGGPYAKSDRRRAGRMPRDRKHFRHEFLSALGWLGNGGDDLTAFLIAAHHGKVRMRVRPRPDERVLSGRDDQVLGVRVGLDDDRDHLPAVELGDLVTRPVDPLPQGLLVLGGGDGPSWSERTQALLAQHGPFRLAWWETLVRIADWRGTVRREHPGTDMEGIGD